MSEIREYKFHWVDVFADRPYEGNPLTVVMNSQTLDDASRYRITQEFGNSETTFVETFVTAADPIRTRIFGLTGELPFAGHPSLGTAFVARGNSGVQKVVLDLKIGQIEVTFNDQEDGTLCEMTQPDAVFVESHSKNDVADAIGADRDAISDDLPLETVSTGNPFIIVPFKRLEDLSHFRMNLDRSIEYLRGQQAMHFYLFSLETLDERNSVHARMIYEKGEDPATGSAAGPLLAYLLKHDVFRSSESIWIEQGVEIGRPSRIRIRGNKTDDAISSIRVAGKCFRIAEGFIET